MGRGKRPVEKTPRRCDRAAGTGTAENRAQVYIASSVYQPAVEAFAKRIGAQAIGTPVEFVDGRVRIAAELVASENKIEQVLSRLGVDRVDFAYGDSALDIPLLEHADHPVAVYPEDKLRAVALGTRLGNHRHNF